MFCIIALPVINGSFLHVNLGMKETLYQRAKREGWGGYYIFTHFLLVTLITILLFTAISLGEMV